MKDVTFKHLNDIIEYVDSFADGNQLIEIAKLIECFIDYYSATFGETDFSEYVLILPELKGVPDGAISGVDFICRHDCNGVAFMKKIDYLKFYG